MREFIFGCILGVIMLLAGFLTATLTRQANTPVLTEWHGDIASDLRVIREKLERMVTLMEQPTEGK